jgi:hypothetical protein
VIRLCRTGTAGIAAQFADLCDFRLGAAAARLVARRVLPAGGFGHRALPDPEPTCQHCTVFRHIRVGKLSTSLLQYLPMAMVRDNLLPASRLV